MYSPLSSFYPRNSFNDESTKFLCNVYSVTTNYITSVNSYFCYKERQQNDNIFNCIDQLNESAVDDIFVCVSINYFKSMMFPRKNKKMCKCGS